MRHRLLVMGAKRRQFPAEPIERFSHPGDIAMAEDRPNAGEDRQLDAIDHGFLRDEEARERLRHGEAVDLHVV